MFELLSVIRGILAMSIHSPLPAPKWAMKWELTDCDFWLDAWTPIWHRGRGPYISISLGPVRIFRGY